MAFWLLILMLYLLLNLDISFLAVDILRLRCDMTNVIVKVLALLY